MNIRRLTRAVTRSTLPSSPPRLVTRAAGETVALVLDEDAPVPDSDQDVADLVMRLRGHVMELGALAGTPSARTGQLRAAFAEAQRLAGEEAPAEVMPARTHLRRFAQAVDQILDHVREESASCLHTQVCPTAGAPDWEAAIATAHCPELGYSLLCNGAIIFDDTGGLLPDGRVIAPHRPLTAAHLPVGAVS